MIVQQYAVFAAGFSAEMPANSNFCRQTDDRHSNVVAFQRFDGETNVGRIAGRQTAKDHQDLATSVRRHVFQWRQRHFQRVLQRQLTLARAFTQFVQCLEFNEMGRGWNKWKTAEWASAEPTSMCFLGFPASSEILSLRFFLETMIPSWDIGLRTKNSLIKTSRSFSMHRNLES